MRRLFFAALLLLAGCAAGGSNPPPLPGPPFPSAVPRPGTLAFAADWTKQPLGVALRCGGPGLDYPFGCILPPGAEWGVLPDEVTGGSDCIDPQPSACLQPSGGLLGYHGPSPGRALISALTLPRDHAMSVEVVVTATNDCSKPVAYAGPVLYDGEGAGEGVPGKYYALYLACWTLAGDTATYASVYSGMYADKVSQIVYAPGSTHALRIDFYPGDRVEYYADGALVYTETAGSLTPGPVAFEHDPHPALWFGASSGRFGRFDVFTAP